MNAKETKNATLEVITKLIQQNLADCKAQGVGDDEAATYFSDCFELIKASDKITSHKLSFFLAYLAMIIATVNSNALRRTMDDLDKIIERELINVFKNQP